MSLFTDSDVSSSLTLQRLDSEILTVAASVKPPILIDGPGGICEAGWQECGRKILQAMQSYVSYPAQTGMPATHIAAVVNVGVPARTQSRVRLNQIIATEPTYAAMDSQIERWVQYYALYLFYRDASGRLGKDRFEDKMVRYDQEATKAWARLRTEGLPMIYRPLEAPGAKHGFGAGKWGLSNVSTVTGGSNSAQQPGFVAITYYDSSLYVSQTNNGNAESGPSALVPYQIDVDQLLHVDITSLNPPTGMADPVGLSQGTVSPLNATHWNLWAGTSSDTLFLQQEGIPIATRSFTLSGDPVATGPTMGRGQFASLNQVFLNLVNRG